MNNSGYAPVAKLVGAACAGVGLAAVGAGLFAQNFVTKQLKSEAITMPDAHLIAKEAQQGLVDSDDARQLAPHAGKLLASGPQARIYADNYVLAHMRHAARLADVPEEYATYNGVGTIIAEKTKVLRAQLQEDPENADKSAQEIAVMAKMEIADADSDYAIAHEIARLNSLRSDNFFMGNAIRGMLLNAYAWWLVGLAASSVGGVMVGLGGILGLSGNRAEKNL